MMKILVAVFFVLFLFGCSDSSDNHPLLRKAAQSKRMGEYRNAETCYKRYLAKDPNAAQIHLELAELYDEHLEEYLLAVYHYKEFLRLTEDKESRTAKSVKGFIERSERRYLNKDKAVKKVFLTDEAEIERMTQAYKKRLADEEAKLAKELAELKKEAEAAKAPELAEKSVSDSAVEKKELAEKNKSDSPVASSEKIEVSEKQTADSAVKKDEKTSTLKEEKAEKKQEEKVEKTETSASDKIAETAEIPVEKVKENAVKAEKAEVRKTEKEPEKETGNKPAETIKDFSKLPEMETVETAVPKTVSGDEIKEYKVQKGDTFTHLSRKFYGTVRYYRQLMEYNKISNPNSLRIGKTIKVPPLEILKGKK